MLVQPEDVRYLGMVHPRCPEFIERLHVNIDRNILEPRRGER